LAFFDDNEEALEGLEAKECNSDFKTSPSSTSSYNLPFFGL